ncbi:MAG: hypothetical protein LBF15_05665 [Candidatus Peribacteria bacterium]|nr:hypothetical protein [Candidatus Peribacteria bacterium]
MNNQTNTDKSHHKNLTQFSIFLAVLGSINVPQVQVVAAKASSHQNTKKAKTSNAKNSITLLFSFIFPQSKEIIF